MMVRVIVGIAIGVGVGAVLGYFGKCSSGACPLTANPFRGAVYGGVMGALLSVSIAGASGGGPGAKPVADQLGGEVQDAPIIHISSADDFEKKVLGSNVPSLVDFYSDHCGPCRRLAPTIEALAESYRDRAVICKVSLDVAPMLAEPHGIRGIPAVLFFDGGKEVQRLMGVQAQSAYEQVLDSLISERREAAKEGANADL